MMVHYFPTTITLFYNIYYLYYFWKVYFFTSRVGDRAAILSLQEILLLNLSTLFISQPFTHVLYINSTIFSLSMGYKYARKKNSLRLD